MPLTEHSNTANSPEDLAASVEKKLSLGSTAAQPEEDVELQPSDMKLRELAGDMDDELLLKDNPGRYVIFPIQHQDVSESGVRHSRTTSSLSPMLPSVDLDESRRRL